MASEFAAKALNTAHRGLLKITGGKAGWRVSKMPVLQLTTTGRQTGQPRSVMLTSPVQEGTTLVIVASGLGGGRYPAWFLNLRDQPRVEVTYQGKPTQTMRARVANTEERERLWPLVVAAYKNYEGYQTRSEREIPLVLLEA